MMGDRKGLSHDLWCGVVSFPPCWWGRVEPPQTRSESLVRVSGILRTVLRLSVMTCQPGAAHTQTPNLRTQYVSL